jgi:hypothetical protein
MARNFMTPEQMSKKWVDNTKNGVQNAIDGVNRVSESPMDKAAARLDKAKLNFAKAIDSGRTAAALKAVPLTKWKEVTASKMAERTAGGVDAAADGHKVFAAYLMSTVKASSDLVDKMPSMTIQDSIARATAHIKYMAEHPYKK